MRVPLWADYYTNSVDLIQMISVPSTYNYDGMTNSHSMAILDTQATNNTISLAFQMADLCTILPMRILV